MARTECAAKGSSQGTVSLPCRLLSFGPIQMAFPRFFSIDRWDFYQDYIRTVMELVKNKAELKDGETNGDKPSIDTSFESCHEFLCEVSCHRRRSSTSLV